LKKKDDWMSLSNPRKPRRVLIASSHALFGQGLRSLLQERHAEGVAVVGMVTNLDEAMAALDRLNPDLVIVDYDDEALNRDEFLARFVGGEKKLRVVLLSLQGGGEAIVYDRRTLAASQIDRWLEEWSIEQQTKGWLRKSSAQREEPKSKVYYRSSDMKHFVIAGILVVIVTALLIFGMQFVRILPVSAAAQAVPIDNLFHLEFNIIAFLFSLIVVMMLYSIVVFRRRKGDLTDGPHIEGHHRLEVAWTIAPLITVLFLAYLGGQSLAETLRPDPRPLEIKVIAQQWSWRFEYVDSGIVSTTLMLPENKQALLQLTSNDVIHSFWVPEFRVKQDALPGGEKFVRNLRVTPTLIGDYKVRCAELCGLQHATMESPVKVVSETDFNDWVAQETGASADPVARGQKLAQTYGCVACHSADGSQLPGPTWKGVFGHEVTLTDGSTVTADEAYLRESILNPGAKIVKGFPNIMPATFGQQLSDEQVTDLIEYIKSLK